MGHLKNEQLRIFFLDAKNHLISEEVLSEGTVDHTPVYPREVVKRTLNLGASAVILAHNHPSGDPTPSRADEVITKEIRMALAPLNIFLHEHIIIGGGEHFSFGKHGLL